jgi:anti-sigma factor RsiW
MTELSDELLVAYVDGQLARGQTLAVDKVLEQDDVLARRVVALKDAHSRLEAAFAAILRGEEAELEAQQVPRARGVFVSWSALTQATLATAGIVIAILMLLAGFGWPLKMPEFARTPTPGADPEIVGSIERDWREEAARAQALLGRDSIEIGLESQGNADLAAFQLAQVVGPNLIVPDLGPQGFRFRRAQLLRYDGEPLAQLLYLGENGAPLALYAMAGEGDSTLRFKRYGELGGVTWSQGAIVYMLAGDADEASLLALAETIAAKPAAGKSEIPAADPAPDHRPPPLPRHKPKL